MKGYKVNKTAAFAAAKEEAYSTLSLPHLSQRLKLIAAFVPQDSRIADIGTDHGFVPIYLAKQGRIKSALAMDVRKGPLERAAVHIKEAAVSDIPIETRLSDGLQKLKPGEADTVIVAGMGGELELRILRDGKHLWNTIDRFILSPQSDLEKVRRFLAENGFQIEKEAMLREDGKYYTVMSVIHGSMEYEKTCEYRYGKLLLKQKDPVLKEYLGKERDRIRSILAALPRENDTEQTPGQKKARIALLEELSWIREAEYEMQ